MDRRFPYLEAAEGIAPKLHGWARELVNRLNQQRYAIDNRVGVPVGTITIWAGSTSAIPTGWLRCTGGSVAVVDYPALHEAIGYTFGGAGANFTLPGAGAPYAGVHMIKAS